MRMTLVLATMLAGFGCVPPPPPAGGGTGGAGGGPPPGPACKELARAIDHAISTTQSCATDADCVYEPKACASGASAGSPFVNRATAAEVVDLDAKWQAANCGTRCGSGQGVAYCAPSQVCRSNEESPECKSKVSVISQEIEQSRCKHCDEAGCKVVFTPLNLPYVCGICVKGAVADKLLAEFHEFAVRGCGDEHPTPPCP